MVVPQATAASSAYNVTVGDVSISLCVSLACPVSACVLGCRGAGVLGCRGAGLQGCWLTS